jgi:antitoxin (DNA-binding transcriptional repressor) of toxin-antitoxin stability system
MRTLTVEEAGAGLGSWVERALAGEQIQIRRGDGVVELRPTKPAAAHEAEPLPPREALRRLQGETRLSAEQAARYLQAVREERLFAEDRREEI